MNILKRYWWVALALVFIAFLLFGPDAKAGTAAVNWTNPTSRTDGTLLLASEITGSRVEYGTCAGTAFGTRAGEVLTNGAVTTANVVSLTAGTFCFHVQTLAGALASGWSNVASKVIVAAPPNPPVLTTVVQTAWILKLNWRGNLRLARVRGFKLPLGAACGLPVGTRWPNHYYVDGSLIGRCG